MRPTTTSCTIDVPREQVFEYLLDIANHSEFTDHFLEDFRLERLDSRGVGAAATFKVACPLGSVWAEVVMTAVETPHRIGFEGGAGRRHRIKLGASYTLTLHGQTMTRVELTVSSEPATRLDALRESLGGRLWVRRQSQKALRRMRAVLEEGEPAARAVRVAAG
jgi:uncharacterized protein YndB with AHSA1/START domain